MWQRDGSPVTPHIFLKHFYTKIQEVSDMSFFSNLFSSFRSSSPANSANPSESSALETVETPVENPKLTMLLADYAQADDIRKPELLEKIAEK